MYSPVGSRALGECNRDLRVVNALPPSLSLLAGWPTRSDAFVWTHRRGPCKCWVSSCSARTSAFIAGIRFVSYWLCFCAKANGFSGAAFAESDYQSGNGFLSSRLNLFLAVYQTLTIAVRRSVYSCDIFLCWGTSAIVLRHGQGAWPWKKNRYW